MTQIGRRCRNPWNLRQSAKSVFLAHEGARHVESASWACLCNRTGFVFAWRTEMWVKESPEGRGFNSNNIAKPAVA